MLWTVYADDLDGVILFTKENIIDNFVDFFIEKPQLQKEQSLLWVS